jgi:hypothetical protein
VSHPPAPSRYRTFFWPAVFIVVGVIALLANAGAFSADRLFLLADLWPLILIVVGLEILARRALHGPVGEAAALLIFVVAGVGALAYVALAPNTLVGAHTLSASAATGSVSEASLAVDVGAATITTISNPDLGADLYHVQIHYSGAAPDVSFDRSTGTLQISESNGRFVFFQNPKLVLNVELNPGVPWTITENSGAATAKYMLGGLNLKSMELNTGASRDDITLGTPSGIVPISINGGAVTVDLHRSTGTAASVSVSGGAISLDGDGHQTHAIGDATWESANFGGATDGFRIQVSGGACTVTMDTRNPTPG